MAADIDHDGAPHHAALHIGDGEHGIDLSCGGEHAGKFGAVRAGDAVIEEPVIGQSISISIRGRGRECHTATHSDRGSTCRECGGRRSIARKRSAIVSDVERGRIGAVLTQHGEVHVALVIGESAPDGDAAIIFAIQAALRGIQQVAGV